MGEVVIRLINSFWLLIQITINGGATLFISGDFDVDKLATVLQAARKAGPLVPEANTDLILFLFMLILIVIGYVVSGRIRRTSSPLLGLFLGIMNGMLLAYVFLPGIAAGTLLPELQSSTPLGLLVTLFGSVLKIVLSPLQWLYTQLGNWLFVGLIALVVFVAARSLRS